MSISSSVCPLLRNEFLISLKMICSVPRMFQDCSLFQENFKGVLKMFNGYLKEVSRIFEDIFNCFAIISWEFEDSFKNV